MDFRYFKATPDAPLAWPVQPEGQEPDFVLVALERTNDPDANSHTGFDFFGAYGDGAAIDTWAADQSVDAINAAALPNPVTYYPAPFNEA
jgi:hypothetical protein